MPPELQIKVKMSSLTPPNDPFNFNYDPVLSLLLGAILGCIVCVYMFLENIIDLCLPAFAVGFKKINNFGI